MKKLIVIAVAMMVAFAAVPAFASVQNVKISGWSDNTFIHRNNFDLGCTGAPGGVPCVGVNDEQNLFINQTGIQIDADLTDQVFFTWAVITESGWANDRGDEEDSWPTSDVDVYLAYVTLKEMLYSPLTLVVGRQNFSFGNGLVFDSTGVNNLAPGDSGISGIAQDLTKQTAMDAIRAILDYNPLTVTVFYAKLDQNTETLSDLDDDVDLWGVNANYLLGDDMDTVIEAYFFKARDKSGNTLSFGGAPPTVLSAETEYIKVVGARASTNPIEGLNIQGEIAYQGGTERIDSSSVPQYRKISAWAIQGIVNYQIPAFEEYNPVLQYVFTKVTGDTDTDTSSGNQTDWTGWNPFFEAQGGGHIYNAIFDLTNSVIHSIYLTAEPMEDVTVRLAATSLWLERNVKGGMIPTRQPDGRENLLYATRDGSHLGKELDIDVTYDYTEDVQLGLSAGWFWPGSAFSYHNDDSAKQLLVNMNVAF